MKQFDFEQVGKRIPYKVPNRFFDEFEDDVYASLGEKPHIATPHFDIGSKKARIAKMVLHAVLAVAAAVALLLAVRPLLPTSSSDDFESVELAFNNLSTEDQDFLLQVYEEDELFMNP